MELCTVAIKGEVIDIQPYAIDMKSGTELDGKLLNTGSLPQENYTKYTVKVIDCYIGSVDGETIEYYELGNIETLVTKPKEKVNVILFLSKFHQVMLLLIWNIVFLQYLLMVFYIHILIQMIYQNTMERMNPF